jgi:hypothetical protein
MPYSNIKEMDDSIDSKSNPLHVTNIWANDINNEVNDQCPKLFCNKHDQY